METCFFAKKNDAFDSALLGMQEFNYVSYDGMDLLQEGQANIRLAAEYNQEEALIKKDLFLSLSPDAHFVIEAINEGKCLTPKTGNITKRSVELFLTKLWRNEARSKKALMEIQNFVFQISEY